MYAENGTYWIALTPTPTTTAAAASASDVTRDGRGQTSATIVAVQQSGERCFFHTPGVTTLIDADAFRVQFESFRRAAWLQIGYFGLLPGLTEHLPALLAAA